jgi:hypothetical protein
VGVNARRQTPRQAGKGGTDAVQGKKGADEQRGADQQRQCERDLTHHQ